MTRRKISAKQREWLTSELDSWRSQQLVSADQAGRILEQYETQAQLAERGRSLLLLTLMGVAALLIGLAVLLLVGYNWGALSVQVKLLLIFLALVVTQAAAFWLRYRQGKQMLSEIAFCIACLLYGAAIFLIAQVFHLNAHYPDGVWWWAMGVLPFALCMESVLLHVLLVALLAIWCGMEVLGFGDAGMWFFGRWGLLPNGAYSLPLFALPGVAWAYRRGSLAALWLYVPLLAWWAAIQPFAWSAEEASFFSAGTVAAMLLLAAEGHPRGSRFAAPYRECGTLLAACVLMALSFHDLCRETFEYQSRSWRADREISSAECWVMLAFAWMATVAALRLAPGFRETAPLNGTSGIERLASSARRGWLPVGLLALITLFVAWWTIQGGALLPTILANVAVVVLGFWLINTGLHQDAGRTFASGVIFLLLWAVMRYIDLFGDFGGMLGAAAVFFLCGLTLFGVAWYWRHRGEVHHV